MCISPTVLFVQLITYNCRDIAMIVQKATEAIFTINLHQIFDQFNY